MKYQTNTHTNSQRHHDAQRGFTIIELLIATVVFSMVLLLCATGIIYIGRVYYKGITMSRVQDASRDAIDDLSQTIQFSKTSTPITSATGNTTSVPVVPLVSYCIGSARYTVALNQQLGTLLPHVFWKDHIAGNAACTTPDLAQANPSPTDNKAVELVGKGMRVSQLQIAPTVGQIASINFILAYGDDDLFANPPTNTVCKSEVGSQFCATSIISTTVTKRLQ